MRANVIIVGSGPAGMGAAIALAERGVQDILLLERSKEFGGLPARYSAEEKPSFLYWPKLRMLTGPGLTSALKARFDPYNITVRLGALVQSINFEWRSLEVVSPTGRETLSANAIVLACGAREKTVHERQDIFSARPAGVTNSMQVLNLVQKGFHCRRAQVGVINDEDISYAVASALTPTSGARAEVTIYAKQAGPKSLLARYYFSNRLHARRMPFQGNLYLSGYETIEGISAGEDAERQPLEMLILSGDLVPNTELAASCLAVDPISRRLPEEGMQALEAGGVFLAGAMRGGRLGAYAAFQNGMLAAVRAARYLNR